MRKRVNRIRLISDSNKIKDYTLELQSSSSQDPMTVTSNAGGMPIHSQSGAANFL